MCHRLTSPTHENRLTETKCFHGRYHHSQTFFVLWYRCIALLSHPQTFCRTYIFFVVPIGSKCVVFLLFIKSKAHIVVLCPSLVANFTLWLCQPVSCFDIISVFSESSAKRATLKKCISFKSLIRRRTLRNKSKHLRNVAVFSRWLLALYISTINCVSSFFKSCTNV